MDMETAVMIAMVGTTLSTLLTAGCLTLLTYNIIWLRTRNSSCSQHARTNKPSRQNLRDKRSTKQEQVQNREQSSYDFSELDRQS